MPNFGGRFLQLISHFIAVYRNIEDFGKEIFFSDLPSVVQCLPLQH